MSLILTVFFCTYVIIVLGIIHRTAAALVGAVIMLAIGALTPGEMLQAINFETIGLLAGMMIIVGITRTTGVFEFLAVKAVRFARGEPVKILTSLSLITAVLSAFLDNVTTVMLIIPVTFAIIRQLQVNPFPYLMAIIFASNIGGAATMIGDPPNIMISSFTSLGFMDFVLNLAPVAIVVYVVTVYSFKLIFKGDLLTFRAFKRRIMNLRAADELKDRVLLYKCALILGLTTLGFMLAPYLNLKPAQIALLGAVVLLLISNFGLLNSLKLVEWSVLIFFVSLFIMVGVLDKYGVFETLAKICLEVTDGNMLLMALTILWLSALTSAFVDNIPFVAAMIPLIRDIGYLGCINDLNFLWWSLSLGACLGGNGTPIGASANVVVLGMAERRGLHISYLSFIKVAFPLMLLSIVISSGYLLVWYFLNAIHS